MPSLYEIYTPEPRSQARGPQVSALNELKVAREQEANFDLVMNMLRRVNFNHKPVPFPGTAHQLRAATRI